MARQGCVHEAFEENILMSHASILLPIKLPHDTNLLSQHAHSFRVYCVLCSLWQLLQGQSSNAQKGNNHTTHCVA